MLTIENLRHSYGEKLLFNGIHLIVNDEDRIGLIGVNGTGKSTLLKIIAGIEQADFGIISHPNDYTIEYLPQNPDFSDDMTVLEYIYTGTSKMIKVLREYEEIRLQLERHPQDEQLQNKLIEKQHQMDTYDAWEANATAETILTKMGITQFEQNITELSGGQKKRVAIAKALIQPANLLILDEPTNHLDNDTIVWLEQHLKTYEGALLLVTHDRYFLNRVTNYIYELDNGKLFKYEGNYELYIEKKLERDELEKDLQKRHENLLRREMAWLKRGARARSTKQRARVERIDDLKSKTFNTTDENIDIQVGSTRLGRQVIELKEVGKQINNQFLWRNFSLLITPGDRIGVIGPNGSGKSTLLNVIAGRLQPNEGEITVGETVKFGYYTQGEEELNGDLRVIDYIKEVAEVIRTKDGVVITAEQMLERFLFTRPKQWHYIHSLSGGEKRRLYLLKILMEEPNVIILDEPTNDLDIKTLGILEDYLEHFPGVVITVSHDRYFLDNVVDELIVFDGEGQLNHFYGNYSDYAAKLESTIRTEKKVAEPKHKPQRESQKRKRLSYLDQKEWETIEDEITALEEEIERIEAGIAEHGSDYTKIQELFKKQQHCEEQLEMKMERWEELSLMVENLEQ